MTVRALAGRLGIVQFHDGTCNITDLPRLRVDLMSFLASVAGKALLFTDMTKLQSFADEVKEPLTAMLRADNPRLERNALLAQKGTRVVLQAHNIVRGADSRARRVFTSKAEVEAWLGELTTPVELEALRKTLQAIA